MVGEFDKLTPPSLSMKMHDLISDSELHILSGAAHMSNLENAEEFNSHLMNFLKRIRNLERH